MKKIITAKEQFDADVKKCNAQYVDEVCEVHYYYMENVNFGYLMSCYDENKQYFSTRFDKFSEMFQKHGMAIAKHFIEHYEDSEHLKALIATKGEELPTGESLTWYCDFLFCNANLCNSQRVYEDVCEEVEDEPNIIGAECTDVNAISSMVEFLKRQLISKIEAQFSVLDEKRICISKSPGRDFFNDINVSDNDMWLEIVAPEQELQLCFNYWHSNKDVDGYSLTCLNVDELLHIYSQLHK